MNINDNGIRVNINSVKDEHNKTYNQVDVQGMSQYQVVNKGLTPAGFGVPNGPINSNLRIIDKNSKIIIPNGRNMTILKQTLHDDDSKNISLIFKDADKKNKASITVGKGIDERLLGGGDNYYGKYMKYKQKYIGLKLLNA
jgi:hypothetical protein